MTTDLRAALRAAAQEIYDAERFKKRFDKSDAMTGLADRLVALADTPPTVAELLPMVDATHEVRWQCSIEAKAECRAVYVDGNIMIDWRHQGIGMQRWRSQPMTATDLTQPATLVEVG